MDLENNRTGKDKDFGFPFVEVKPLEAKKKALTKKEDLSKPLPLDDKPIDFGKTEKSIERPFSTIDKKKQRQIPLGISLVFLIVLILVAMAYFFYIAPEQENIADNVSPTSEVSQEQNSPVLEDNTTEEGVEPSEVENEIRETEPSVPPAETTPDADPLGNLQLVENKGEIASYYIIAGSLPNKRLANEEVQQFRDKGVHVWLISPQGNTRNYRLSVGRYDTFQSATQALESAKEEFGESLWILKY
jgi:cytoskeletal protein RodZ